MLGSQFCVLMLGAVAHLAHGACTGGSVCPAAGESDFNICPGKTESNCNAEPKCTWCPSSPEGAECRLQCTCSDEGPPSPTGSLKEECGFWDPTAETWENVVTSWGGCECEASSKDDPHFTGDDNDKFDFKGEDDTVYALLSTNNMSVNGRFSHRTFSNGNQLVHGSFVTSAYMTLALDDHNQSAQIRLAFEAGKTTATLPILIDGALHKLGKDSILTIDRAGHALESLIGKEPAQHRDGTISASLMRSSEVDGEWHLSVANDAWTVSLASKYYPSRKQNGDKQRLDISVKPSSTALGSVAPHGLIGQTFDKDDTAVDGARDNYDDKVVTTKAMGEGAIEGTAKDYEISHGDPHSVLFKYSRWGLATAPPRNVSLLTGSKRSTAGQNKQNAVRLEL